MDLDWREAEELERVKLSSQETAAFEEAQRSANAEAERRRAEENNIHLALSVSRRLAAEEVERQEILKAQRQSEREAQELENIRGAKLQSLRDERARARAEHERKRKAEETIRLKANFAISGLSEDEQLEYAKSLSRDEEHSHNAANVEQIREDTRRFIIDKAQDDELSVTQGLHGHPVLGTHPGAYLASPSQASSAARTTVRRSVSKVNTPKLPGVYQPSCATSEASRGFAGPPPGIPSWMISVARRPLDDSRSSERLIGAYPPSSPASNAPTRSGTVSSEGTFVAACEMQPPQRYARPQPALSEFWRDESSTHHECEAQESRPSTSLSCSSPSSKASCVGRPPSSQTSHESVVRKHVAKSRPLIPTVVESRAPAFALDTATPAVASSSHSQQHPAQYNFYGPVIVNSYNVPGEPSSSSTMLKQVFTKGKEFAKGVKFLEQKNVTGFDLRDIGEATKSRCKSTAAFLRQKSNRFEVSLPSRAIHAPVSESGEIDQVSVPEVQDDVGSIVPLPQTQQWFVTDLDPNRSYLNTPEDGRSLRSEFPVRQTVDVVTPRTPTLQRSVRPPPLPTITRRRPVSPTSSTVSMILDVNGDAMTLPSDRQSGFSSFLVDGSSMSGPGALGPAHDSRMPRRLSMHKTPPHVPRKPYDPAGSRSAKPPPRSRNPTARYMAEAQEGPAEWLQNPVQFPVMHPTQGSAYGSPDTITATAPTPGRVNEALHRQSRYPPIDTNLANVPPGERRIDEFNSRSTADLGRMSQMGVPASMEVLRGQYKQTYARPPQDRQERQNSDAGARVKEKETHKLLRRQP